MAGSSVVLMSGGIESAALLYHWRSSASRLHPLYINYGQKGATMEERACDKLCQHLNLQLGRINMSSVGEEFRALQQPAKSFVPLPHRNLVILALGASYACQVGSRVIALALNKDDLGSYSSSSQSFLDSFRATAATLKPSLTLVAPLSHLTKAQVVTFGNHLGVPFADTYSCMVGRPRHCGHCHQCKLRRQAFAHVSIEEPPGFYEQ
ncbi:unnamed protein product [Sphagnum compactum]